MADHVFISYSAADGLEFATKLADELQGRHPNIKVWFDKRELDASIVDWDDQLANAIKACKCLVFVMTPDSVAKGSTCKEEWTWALKYKKPVICLLKDKKAEVPFRLANRQYIDISTNFEAGIALLRSAIQRLDEPEGILDELDRRLAQAKRDFQRTPHEEEKPRIQAEIDDLNKQIEAQQKIVSDPEGAKAQTQKNIETGLERERKPQLPLVGIQSSKFINPPPGIAPNYFQDRAIETKQVIDFLNDNSQRLMTIVGRGGVGKTAMICRLLKHLENGAIPDDILKIFGEVKPIKVDGIVYLSESGSHHATFANIFYDLCKLLPSDVAQHLDGIYKNPQASTESKMNALVEHFQGERVLLLLDNFEPLVVDSCDDCGLRDSELDEALQAFLKGAHTSVNIIITTRLAPKALNLIQPGKQRFLDLDDGLGPPYAENILREMDSDGRLGLKSASDELLNTARERTQGYPRALEALFAILASDRYTTLEEILSTAEHYLPENVVQDLVGEAFNRLDMNAQKVMQVLAVYNRPVTPAAVDYLLAPHIPAMDSAPILKRLVSMHFARRFEGGKFYLHPVDRDFAFDLIPVGSPDDTFIEKGGLQLFKNLWNLLDKYPDLLQNQDTFNQAVKNENANIVIGSVMAFQNLDDSLVEKMQQEGIFEDENFLAELDKSFHIPPIWSRYALNNRAADYFAAARKPRTEWKKLDDLAAQLAEFDLRCAAGDYDTAASVLIQFDRECLLVWGHYRLTIALYEQILNLIKDKYLLLNILNGLEMAYRRIGDVKKAIPYLEQGLEIAKETRNREGEKVFLNNLGLAYTDFGDEEKAIKFYEQALTIAREIGDRTGAGRQLGNLGNAYADLGNDHKAIELYEQALVINREDSDRIGEAETLINVGHVLINLQEYQKGKEYIQQVIQISDEFSYQPLQLYSRWEMVQTYLFQNDLVNASATIEAALQFDAPEYNHNVSALHGIIALRQGDEVTARGAFVRAIGQADEILSKTAEYYSALDAKGISLAGLTILDLRFSIGEPERNKHLSEAVETFRKARKIAPHAGVVKSVLRLFDELAKCDTEGILKDVRSAAAGSE